MRTLATTLALSLALPVIGAQAASLNIYANCALLPWGTFGAPGVTTAVGLTSRVDGAVEWAFFNPNGDRLDSGRFSIDADELAGITLDAVLTPLLANSEGFMLFCLDSNGDEIIDNTDETDLAANAFYVDLPNNDVAYLPVWSVDDGDLDDPDPDNWTSEPLVSISLLAAVPGHELDMQYLIDGTPNSGDGTRIILFTTDETNLQTSMQAFGPGGQTPVDVPLPNRNLNVVDVESVEEFVNLQGLRPSGYLRWVVPANAGSTVAFSLVGSPTFGALQTLIGNWDLSP